MPSVSSRMSPNQREAISAVSTVTLQQEYLSSTNKALNVNVTGGGTSGTQYTDGSVTVTHPIGTIPVYDKSGVITAVSVANPLPVAATFTGTVTSSPTFAQNPGNITPTPAFGLIDSSFRPQVSVATALPAGTNVIGHVITDTGSTTAVTGTVTVSGTVTTTPPSNASTNIAQINGITPLMGNGVTGTGSQRVTIASDNTAFTVNAAQSGTWNVTNVSGTVSLPTGASTAAKQPALGTAGTPSIDVLTVQGATSMTALKVDGSGVTQPVSATSLPLPTGAATSANQTNASQKTQLVDGSGNVIAATSNALNVAIVSGGGSGGTSSSFGATFPTTGTAIGAKNGLNMVNLAADASSNLLVSVNTAIPAGTNAIGSITNTSFAATQATAASLNATVVGTGTFAVQAAATLAAETTKVIGVVRNADGSGNLVTSTANALDVNLKSGSIANTSFAATQATASSLNATVVQGVAAALGAPWPTYNGEQTDFTGTFTNATQTTSVTATNLDGYGNILISINGTYGTATAVFEGSDDSGTTWYPVDAAQTSGSTIDGGYTSLTNITRSWQINVPGFDSVRVRSTAVASGTVNVRMSASAALGADASAVSIGSSLPTGSNVIGHVIADSGSTTAVTQATASNLNAQTVGPTASGSALSANPLTAGGLAKTTNPTAVSDAQVVNSLYDKLGKQVVVGSIRDLKVQQVTTITASTAETTILTAVASTFLDVYGMILTNTSATATNVAVKDATAGTTRFNIAVPAGDTRGFMLNESAAHSQAAVNNNWTATSSASVTSLIVTVLAVKNI